MTICHEINFGIEVIENHLLINKVYLWQRKLYR